MMLFQHNKLLKIYESFKTCLKNTNMQQNYVVCVLFCADHSSCFFFAFDYCTTSLCTHSPKQEILYLNKCRGVFLSFGLEKADYFLFTGEVCLWKIYEVIVILSEVISDFVPKCEMYLLVTGPHQDNKYMYRVLCYPVVSCCQFQLPATAVIIYVYTVQDTEQIWKFTG